MLIALLSGFLLAVVITPLVIAVYRKYQWIDDPAQKKHVKITHKVPVPRGGGLVIGVSVILAAVLLIPMTSQLVFLLIGALILTVVGMIDDIYDIHPYWRLGVGLFVALLVVVAGVDIEYITHPFQSGVLYINSPSFLIGEKNIEFSFPFLSSLLTILWIVWNMNIVNWSKGIDGQLPGVVGIAAAFIGILSFRFAQDPSQVSVILLSFIVAGAFLGLLIWNAYPQKIMPGYGAGSLGGYFLAILAILSGAKLATALLVLALPTADALFTISRRLLNKKSPFWGDRGHLHHKLIDVLGWTKPQIALFYWATTAIMGVIALQLKPEQKLFTMTVVTALVFGFLIWAKLFISFSRRHDQDSG